jgi:hypothetical protein
VTALFFVRHDVVDEDDVVCAARLLRDGNKCDFGNEGYMGQPVTKSRCLPRGKHNGIGADKKIKPAGNTGFFNEERGQVRSTVQRASWPNFITMLLFVCSTAPVKRKFDHGIGVIPPIIPPTLRKPLSGQSGRMVVNAGEATSPR